MSSISRFLGDSPGRVAVRLVVLSFVVGVVMAALGLEPLDLWYRAVDVVEGIWNLGFGAVEKVLRYFLLGAVVVIPLWLLSRLMKVGGGRA